MLENEKNMSGQIKLLLVDDEKGFADIIVKRMSKQMDPDLSVIMLTGQGSKSAAKDGIKFGAFDYLTKPYGFWYSCHDAKSAKLTHIKFEL